MSGIDFTARLLAGIGAVNWGLVALAEFDLVAAIFGLEFGQTNALTRVVYGLVGLAGAAQVITVFSVAYGLLQLAYGPLGDRHGKWRVVTLAVLASAATAFACAAATDFTVLLIAIPN